MAKKCYAIRKGNRIGIAYSWDECKSAISGYSGAEYRGFNDEEEAVAYLNGHELVKDKESGKKFTLNEPTSDDVVNIYTDGSYKDGSVAFGVFIQASNGRKFKFYGVVECKQYASLNNIAGELLAVLVGVQLAKDMGFKRYNIVYDYEGVESWYKGTWQAKGMLQSIYVTLLNQLRTQYDLAYKFFKVKGHSGVEGNVIADKMATRARNFNTYVDLDAILRGILTVRDVPLAP